MAVKTKKNVLDFETAINEAAPYYVIFGYKYNFGNVPSIVLVSKSFEEVKDRMKEIINDEFNVAKRIYNAYEVNSVSSGIVDIPILLNEQSGNDKQSLIDKVDSMKPLVFRIEETDETGNALIFESSSVAETKAQAKEIMKAESADDSSSHKEYRIKICVSNTDTFRTICVLNK